MNSYLSMLLNHQTPDRFSGQNQHLTWHWLAEGVLLFEPHHPVSHHVIVSAGIHGNETAPVEILCHHVDALFTGEMVLNVRLMVIFGNLAAMRDNKRFIHVDLNRLFSGKYCDYTEGVETLRAREIEQYVNDFFSVSPPESRIHFDLHTAIRGSHYMRFGVLPKLGAAEVQSGFVSQLQVMGLEALVINPIPGGTFSFYTADCFGAQSCTLELGQAQPFGTNDLSQFKKADEGLARLFSSADALPVSNQQIQQTAVKIYRVCQELKKYSDHFHFPDIDESVKNFTRFEQGTLIARDGDVEYRVKHSYEWLIFPNASVRNGLRAGMMLEAIAWETLMESMAHSQADPLVQNPDDVKD